MTILTDGQVFLEKQLNPCLVRLVIELVQQQDIRTHHLNYLGDLPRLSPLASRQLFDQPARFGIVKRNIKGCKPNQTWAVTARINLL